MSDLPEAAGRVWGGSWLGYVVASRRPGAGGGGVEGDRRVAAPALGFPPAMIYGGNQVCLPSEMIHHHGLLFVTVPSSHPKTSP